MGKPGNQDIRGTVDRGVNRLSQFLKRDIHWPGEGRERHACRFLEWVGLLVFLAGRDAWFLAGGVA